MESLTPKQFAIDVAHRLQEAGFVAYWAGGCVRDQLLGLSPKDYDVATNAKPEQIRNLFGRKKTLALGAAFGVITIIGPKSAGHVEVASFRSDGPYSDGRRPDEVVYATAEMDAQRRDFTINGIFFDPIANQVIDFVDGQNDLTAGLIRGIGDPNLRIAEDKLRMIRAVRFAATYGFDIEPLTLAAIRRHADEITVVSVERIWAELHLMLVHQNRRLAVELLVETGLLCFIIPELETVVSDPNLIQMTLRTLDDLQRSRLELCLAALLSNVPRASERVAHIAKRLKLPSAVAEGAAWILKTQPVFQTADSLPWSTVQPVIIHPLSRLGLALAETELQLQGKPLSPVRFCQQQLERPNEEIDPPALVDGDCLKTLGYSPGPLFSVILADVRAAQLDGEIKGQSSALEFIRKKYPKSETF